MDFLECCTCAVCLEPFVDPRMLSCGHTYCQKCIEPLLRQGLPRKITCPECRSESTLPANGFPVNFSVRGMVSKIQASSGVRGIDACEECQKKVPLSELFSCSTCTHPLAETVRVCSMCMLKSHNGHDYKELGLPSKQDIDNALQKIATEHAVCSYNKQTCLEMKGTIAGAVLWLEKRLDERIASMNALATDLNVGTTMTKDQLSDKVKEIEQCGQKGDVAAALTALRECSRNLLQIPAIQQASSRPVPGVATRSTAVDEQDVRASAWRRRFNACLHLHQAMLSGAASADVCPPPHRDI